MHKNKVGFRDTPKPSQLPPGPANSACASPDDFNNNLSTTYLSSYKVFPVVENLQTLALPSLTKDHGCVDSDRSKQKSVSILST